MRSDYLCRITIIEKRNSRHCYLVDNNSYIKYSHFGIIVKMSEGQHRPFELKDFFREALFRIIVPKRRGDTYFYNAYFDYNQDLETLRIAWRRLKQGCKDEEEDWRFFR